MSCEGGPRSVPRGLELGARGGLGRALPGRSTGVLSHGRGRADGFSGPPAGAAPRNDGLLDSSAGATLFVLLMYSLRTLRLHALCLRLCAGLMR